jgi:hypothetical protein
LSKDIGFELGKVKRVFQECEEMSGLQEVIVNLIELGGYED